MENRCITVAEVTTAYFNNEITIGEALILELDLSVKRLKNPSYKFYEEEEKRNIDKTIKFYTDLKEHYLQITKSAH